METKKNYKLGNHLVAFLDVLGQREKFRGLQLPKDDAEDAKVKEVLRQTAGFVVHLRAIFKSEFEIFEKTVRMSPYTTEPVRPKFVGFSDSFVTSVPLWNDDGPLLPVVTVFSAMAAAGVVMLTSLASKHPLRGGIDVGLATEISEGEIYGTALERAYLLECKVARYPRIVIGDELWRYLNAIVTEFGAAQTPLAKSITAITKKLMALIAVDVEGARILDYLGEVVLENSAPAHKESMVQPAYEFVLAEQNRIAAVGDTELLERYSMLRGYFESRLPSWGIPIRN